MLAAQNVIGFIVPEQVFSLSNTLQFLPTFIKGKITLRSTSHNVHKTVI